MGPFVLGVGGYWRTEQVLESLSYSYYDFPCFHKLLHNVLHCTSEYRVGRVSSVECLPNCQSLELPELTPSEKYEIVLVHYCCLLKNRVGHDGQYDHLLDAKK